MVKIDTLRLRILHQKGLSTSDIAVAMGVSPVTIDENLEYLGLRPNDFLPAEPNEIIREVNEAKKDVPDAKEERTKHENQGYIKDDTINIAQNPQFVKRLSSASVEAINKEVENKLFEIKKLETEMTRRYAAIDRINEKIAEFAGKIDSLLADVALMKGDVEL
jgi:6-phosphofructokinase